MAELNINREQPTDNSDIRDLLVAAFESEAEGDLVEKIRASDDYIQDLSLVAMQQGVVVGHIMISRVGLVDGGTRREVHSLAPVAVAPQFQRQGIGGRLVRAATEAADGRGLALVLLEGNPAYYSRFGFEYAAPHGIHFDLPDWAPPEAGQVIRLTNYDASLRGRVVYPPAFDVGGDS